MGQTGRKQHEANETSHKVFKAFKYLSDVLKDRIMDLIGDKEFKLTITYIPTFGFISTLSVVCAECYSTLRGFYCYNVPVHKVRTNVFWTLNFICHI